MMSLNTAKRIQRAAQPQPAVPAFRHIAYDYTNQAWVVNGTYQSCGHPATMDCRCYGKIHAGEIPAFNAEIH